MCVHVLLLVKQSIYRTTDAFNTKIIPVLINSMKTDFHVVQTDGHILHVIVINHWISSIVGEATHWFYAPEPLAQRGINSGLPTFGTSDGDT